MARNFGIEHKDRVEKELRETEWRVLLGSSLVLATIVVLLYSV